MIDREFMESLRDEMRSGFTAVQERFEGPDARLDQSNARLAENGERLDEQGASLDSLNARLDRTDVKLGDVIARVKESTNRIDRVIMRVGWVEQAMMFGFRDIHRRIDGTDEKLTEFRNDVTERLDGVGKYLISIDDTLRRHEEKFD